MAIIDTIFEKIFQNFNIIMLNLYNLSFSFRDEDMRIGHLRKI